jgi:hypothetical protein
MRTYMKKTMLPILPLAGWLFAAPVVLADDLTAARMAQNEARRQLKADRQEVQEEQRLEREALKEEQRAKRKELPAKQELQEAERRTEKAERQEEKDDARATIHKTEMAEQNIQEENVEQFE